MAIKLNESAQQQGENLIKEGRYVLDRRDDWSEHQPSAALENDFISQNGWDEYGKWFLAIDDAEDAETKARYRFPYGDFTSVHRCGVISAESRAGQYRHPDVEDAAKHLLRLLDDLM
jgi:hypothetical protein